jgi:tetratricopeptide (TPR) repeat protein
VHWLLSFALIPLLSATPTLAYTQSSAPLAEQRQSALSLEQQGQLPEAETAWRAIAKAHPSDVEPYAHIAVLEAHQQHYKEAIVMYRKALLLDPKLPGLRLDLALALFKDGNLKEAIPELNRLLKDAPPSSPQSQRLTILLAMAHYGLAEYAEAVPYLKRAAAADPANLPLRMTLAHSCLWSKQYQCVLDVYHQILTLNAESAEADMLAGEASDAMKDRDAAIAQFRAAIKADPTEPDAHFGLGYLLWTNKQYEEAAPQFEAELAINPSHIQAILYLGDTRMQLNQPDKARPLLEKAIQLDPSLWLAHLDLGILDTSVDKNDDALREMRLAAKLKPDEVSVHWRLAQLDRKLGNIAEAKTEYTKANSLTHTADESVYKKMTGAHPPTPGREPVLGQPNP